MSQHKPKLDNLFRIQTLLYLLDRGDKGATGYDLGKDIEEQQGTRPSSGKIYPFLKELLENGYIEEKGGDTSRNKVIYKLTDKGRSLVDEIVGRMRILIDSRLNVLMEVCHHCGVKLYDAPVIEKLEDGSEMKFCCSHCQQAFHEGVHKH